MATLHDAMIAAMAPRSAAMSTREITELVNDQGLYSRRDRAAVPQNQIAARARKYPHLFRKTPDGRLELTASALASVISTVATERSPEPSHFRAVQRRAEDAAVGSDGLLDDAAFRPVSTFDADAPRRPGLYAIRVKDIDALPSPFREEAHRRATSLIYIGEAKVSLSKRLGQELRARGHGTFFRSLGSALGYRPLIGSLKGAKNDRNFRFSPGDEAAIISWIDSNLEVSWVELAHGVHAAETRLLQQHGPLFNLQGNPRRLRALSDLRALCRSIALKAGAQA